MVIEASLRDFLEGYIALKCGTGRETIVSERVQVAQITTYLNSWSSLMTCMPCSKCSFVGFSPTLAKWPLTVMIEGAVGCRVLLEGREPFVDLSGERDVDMMRIGCYYTTLKTHKKARDAERIIAVN